MQGPKTERALKFCSFGTSLISHWSPSSVDHKGSVDQGHQLGSQKALCVGGGETPHRGGSVTATGGQPPGVAVGWEFIRFPLGLREVSVIRAG